MASEDLNDFSSVTSSIFYAKRNSISKQNQLLDFSLKTPVEITSVQSESHTEDGFSHTTELYDISQQEISTIKKTPVKYQSQPLSAFYPEMPKINEKTDFVKGTSKIRKKFRPSPTKELLSFALEETAKGIIRKPRKRVSEKRVSRSSRTKKEKRLTLNLTQFISEEKVKIKKSITKWDTKAAVQKDETIQKPETYPLGDPLLADTDPFPFTSLPEWLLWHRNYPEFSHVREAFDFDQVPENSGIEVFWVNTMNEPEFFNHNWRIAGIRIENINTIKFKGRPEGTPEWQILPSETDGLSNFFEDVFRILLQNPQGIRNYNYPILQFALKGLKLLNLAYFDDENERWFRKGGIEDLVMRLRVLDQFISDQTNVKDYQRSLELLLSQQDNWYLGIICFDLIYSQSAFLRHLSNFQLGSSEDEKIRVINKSAFQKRIIGKLITLGTLDKIRVDSLLGQLNSN